MLFIDMKYIILYRKLGFSEIQPDIFQYVYGDTSIIIDSEGQKYEFLGKKYPLLCYKDFVILECIDRLLKKGYKSDSILLGGSDCDLLLKSEDGQPVKVFAAQWGKDYSTLCKTFEYSGTGIEVLYTSQLSGGLVDFISIIYTPEGTYRYGLFEREAKTDGYMFSNPLPDPDYPNGFVVKNGELLKYIGKEKDVRIPDGITRIGSGAFWNNLNLESVFIPESVTCICGDAFVYCENLKRANIPESVDQMGDDPFAGCKDISIDNRSPFFINEGGVLFDKDRRFLIHYTASLSGERYEIPETVEWIGKHSFYKCENLKCVRISKNVKFMGNNAFSDCFNIHLENESPYFAYEGGVLYNKEKTTCMHYSMGSGVKDVKLADTVRTIGRNCFWNCYMIDSIEIPKSVRQIGYNPFANCRNVHLINHSPFYDIKDGVLYNSDFTELVCCPSTAPMNGTVTIPDTVINIGRNAFTGCIGLKRLVIPGSVKYISRGAFSECSNLEDIEIPATIEDIGEWCFNKCSSLRQVAIPSNIDVKPNTFNSCGAEVIRK
ncbi:hypothetical protein AOA81_06270 [Methanomassiliicoccales archaeon RumEn M2]|nr:hypothetical protein AOA81_06270 [Methanomassiliicoccales archaeon RumEn M2]